MIGKEEIHRIRELIGAKEGPVLSLYVDVNPAKPENAGRAYALRAKDAIKAPRSRGTFRKGSWRCCKTRSSGQDRRLLRRGGPL